MFGQGFNYGFLGKPLCFTDTTDIFKDNSGVALYTLDYDASDSGGATGKFGEAAIFNGSSSAITLGTDIFKDANITFSAWINSNVSNTSVKTIYGNTSYVNGQQFHGIIISARNNSGVDKVFVQHYPSNTAVYSTGSISLNGYTHIAVSYGSQTKIYINGSLDSTHSASASYSAGQTLTASLGAYILQNYTGSTPTEPFSGSIDQVRVFNKALSSSEVTSLYNETKNTTNTLQILGDTSCIATYKFDGNSSDLSGNYNGTDTNILYKYDGTPTAVDFGVGGKTLYGARFNGSSSYITSNSLPSIGTGDFTFSCWFNQNSGSSQGALFSTTTQWFAANGYESPKVLMVTDDTVTKKGDTAYSQDTWNHAVFARESGVLKIYQNGTEVFSGAYTDSWDMTQFGIGVARAFGSRVYYFNGEIDQVRVFNKALSSAEVSKLYGNGAGEIACEYTSTTDNVAYPIANTAYYKLDNNSKDSARSTGKFNEAAVFNGSSSKIALPNVINFSTGEHTISAWINTTSTSVTRFISNFYTGTVPDGSMDFVWIPASNSISIDFSIGGSNYTNTITGISTGEWYHIAATFVNNGTCTAYLNGSSVDTVIAPSFTATTYQPLNLGYYERGNNYWSGSIDQVRIFNTALDSTDVSNLYAETVSDTSTLSFPSGKTAIATYQLDGNSTDLSGNYNGTDTNITYAYDGTESNIEYRFGRFGQAAVFNGSNAYINLGTSIATSTRGVSMWVNADNFSERWPFQQGDGQGVENYIRFYNTDDIQVRWGNVTQTFSGYSANTWIHIFAQKDENDNANVWINGVEMGSTGTPSAITVNKTYLGVRNNAGTLQYYFDGKIDQVRIFSTALSASQITELYNEKPETDTSNFKTVLYEANASTNFISNVGFQPGLVWTKSRDNAYNHLLYDSVRGAGNYLQSNTTIAQAPFNANTLSSFEATGFILGNVDNSNYLNNTSSVAWVWKGGGDAVSNTDGTITSQVSANTEAGFSIVKYSGNTGADQTVGHGLSSTPEMVIVKRLTDAGYSWCVQHIGLTSMGYNIYLDDSREELLRNRIIAWDSTTFTVEQVHEVNNTGKDYIAYCFHSVSGYSKIGSYEGSGSSQSIYVTDDDTSTGSGGFQPSFVMIKNIDAAANWMMYDAVRDSDGTLNLFLEANTSDSEASAATATISPISNGFTIGNSNSIHINDSTDTYIYMAFK